jgi:hypothetical protein
MATTQDIFPDDDTIPDATMIYNRKKLIQAAPGDVFPWIVQLGKNRGGWYLASFWQRLIPKSWHPSWTTEQRRQDLKVGDRVADYGFSEDDYFDVVEIERPHTLVCKSERLGTVYTWALLCPRDEGRATEVHLRFRGRLQSTGWKRWLIVFGGDIADRLTTAPMLAGLAERCE